MEVHSRGLKDFISCPEHQTALETLMEFCHELTQPTENRSTPTLLYLHGDIGAGKTHLLQSVLAECRKKGMKVDDENVRSFPPKFGYPFRKKNVTPDWGLFSNLDLLVIDDLQHILCWREPRVLAYIIKLMDHFIAEKRGLILAGLDTLQTKDDSLPLGFDIGLLQRLQKGTSVKMGMPGTRTKLEILRRYPNQFPSTSLEAKIEPGVLEWLAGLNRDSRSLLCGLLHLIIIAKVESLQITLNIAKDRLSDRFSV